MRELDLEQLQSLDEGYQMWKIVKKFKQEFRLVMILKYYMGYSTDKIAKALQLTEAVVKQRLDEATGMLGEMM